MTVFDALGFQWDRSAVPADVPTYPVQHVCLHFHRNLAEFVWDAGVLEGNPFTLPAVKALLAGVTVSDHSASDQAQILALAESSGRLLALVRTGAFSLRKAIFVELHRIVACNEALEWGVFRREGQETHFTPDLLLGEHGRPTPLPTIAGGSNLQETFARGVEALDEHVDSPFEKAIAFFLFGALHQFFFDCNKRTSRHMMNGVLMSHGIDAISNPAAQAEIFNEEMVRFYLTKDATEMLKFIADCHPQSAISGT